MNLVKKSGVGRAFEHQKKALHDSGIPYTTNTRSQYDIIQLNTILPDSALAAMIAKSKHKKVIYYGHSTMEDFKQSFLGSNLFAPIYKKWIIFCYGLGDVIITPSDYSKKLIESYGIRKPVVQLSNGIDLTFFSKEQGDGKEFRKKYQFKPDDKVIVSVGHYIERKGILDFVELARSMPQYKFVWFGYTNLSLVPKKIREAVCTKLSNLFFLGYVTKEEIRDAYAGSDGFLFLTYEETEGIVLLEALAMKVPVIVRDIPIYKDWLHADEMVYKCHTIDEFKNQINKLLSKELPDVSEKGYEMIRTKELGSVGLRLNQIYRRLLT